MKWAEVSNLTVAHEETDEKQVDVVVKFDDSSAVRNIFHKISDLHCMYIVQIIPCIETVRFWIFKHFIVQVMIFKYLGINPKFDLH